MKLNRKLWKVSVASLLVVGALVSGRADEKKTEAPLAQYLEQLQTKLDHTAQRANQPNAEGSSVVGLRGTKQESASKQLYWKGKKGKESVSPEEIKIFRGAIEQARIGKSTDAVATLKMFQEKYPKSALGPDVQETLKRLMTPDVRP